MLVDDHLIALRLVTGSFGSTIDRASTTCSWWWRLSAALAGERGGALSRRVGSLEPVQRVALSRAIAALPQRLVILDLRQLIPAMAVLSAEHNLNLLAAEAIVAAEVLGAGLVVGQDTPKIRETARQRGLSYQVAAGECP